MSKKIMLLALAAVTAAMFAVPATASAIVQLHLEPTPVGAQTIESNGVARLSTDESEVTIECEKFGGTANFEAGGTTGTMQLTFGPGCTTDFGGTCTNHGTSSITTTVLPFHLATVKNNAGGTGQGVLVTPNNSPTPEHFASFTCHGVFGFLTLDKVVKGNGVIGTITEPACNGTSTKATIKFETEGHGLQKHRTLVNTAEPKYTLRSSGEHAAQEAHGTLKLNANSKLVCT